MSSFEQIERIFNVDWLSVLMSKLKFLIRRHIWKFSKILALLRIVSTVWFIIIILSIMLGSLTNLYRNTFCLHYSFPCVSITTVLRVLILIRFFNYVIFHFFKSCHNLTVDDIIISICLINYRNTIAFLLVHTYHLGLLLSRNIGLGHIVCTQLSFLFRIWQKSKLLLTFSTDWVIIFRAHSRTQTFVVYFICLFYFTLFFRLFLMSFFIATSKLNFFGLFQAAVFIFNDDFFFILHKRSIRSSFSLFHFRKQGWACNRCILNIPLFLLLSFLLFLFLFLLSFLFSISSLL